MWLHFATTISSYHAAISHRPGAVSSRACAVRLDAARFDALLSERCVSEAVAIMEAESLELIADRVCRLLDTACAVSSTAAPGTTAELQSRQQEELLSVYSALARRGSLRGFGSVSTTGLLPLSLTVRTVTPDDQLRLTGLPTSAFAPPGAGSVGEIAAGTVSALFLSALSEAFALDGRLLFGAVAGVIVADQLLLRLQHGQMWPT